MNAAAAAVRKKGKRQCRPTGKEDAASSHIPLSSLIGCCKKLTFFSPLLCSLLLLVPFVSAKIYILIRSFPRAI